MHAAAAVWIDWIWNCSTRLEASTVQRRRGITARLCAKQVNRGDLLATIFAPPLHWPLPRLKLPLLSHSQCICLLRAPALLSHHWLGAWLKVVLCTQIIQKSHRGGINFFHGNTRWRIHYDHPGNAELCIEKKCLLRWVLKNMQIEVIALELETSIEAEWMLASFG